MLLLVLQDPRDLLNPSPGPQVVLCQNMHDELFQKRTTGCQTRNTFMRIMVFITEYQDNGISQACEDESVYHNAGHIVDTKLVLLNVLSVSSGREKPHILFYLSLIYIFRLCRMACGISVPRLGTRPMSLTSETRVWILDQQKSQKNSLELITCAAPPESKSN